MKEKTELYEGDTYSQTANCSVIRQRQK